MAPMTRGRAGTDRVPNELTAEYYYQRSSAGLLITEATVISKQGIGCIDSPGIYTEEMVAFGRPYITNPDLPERLKNGWTLNPAEDMSLWYTPGPEGYTDYLPFNP